MKSGLRRPTGTEEENEPSHACFGDWTKLKHGDKIEVPVSVASVIRHEAVTF